MISDSLHAGFVNMWTSKRMVLVFYLTYLVFGLLLVLPFRSAVDGFFGTRLIGERLTSLLSIEFILEFLKYHRGAAAAIGGLLWIVPPLCWLVVLFLSGGALGVFVSGKKYSPILFWGSAARYFGRFFRLFLWSLPVFGILFCLRFVELAVERAVFGADPYQPVAYWGEWVRLGLGQVGLMLYLLVLDYARIHVVLADEQEMRKSIWQGIRFTFGHIFRTFSLALILFVFGVIATGVYLAVAHFLEASSVLVVIGLLVIQQATMFFRTMLRVTLYSSQLHLYRQLPGEKRSVEVVKVMAPPER